MRHLWLLAALAWGLAACGSQGPPTLPAELRGVWKTSYPRYADIHFELRQDAVVLHAGEGRYQSHKITAVQSQPEEGATLYRVTYRHAREGTDDVFAFYYSSARGGLIRFKNQRDVVWEREAAP